MVDDDYEYVPLAYADSPLSVWEEDFEGALNVLRRKMRALDALDEGSEEQVRAFRALASDYNMVEGIARMIESKRNAALKPEN